MKLMLQIDSVLITLSFRNMFSQTEDGNDGSKRREQDETPRKWTNLRFSLLCKENGKKCWIRDPNTLEEIVTIGINIYIFQF